MPPETAIAPAGKPADAGHPGGAVDAHIAALVRAAPALTGEQAARLRALLPAAARA